ncbi:hypothetical protein N7493_007630 [Penicillium malachiteum]|uniref:Uncharacterized protein n=1 Tax=Penicillium malachiteum TaxID=1324776 RepID=A0AAD6HHZ2_9EURO|nr:hypothetical protein N7493_007630 [Penicillium malachiteum]
MATFEYLYRFETEKGDEFFAKGVSTEPIIGGSVDAFPTLEDLLGDQNGTQENITKLLPPIPQRASQFTASVSITKATEKKPAYATLSLGSSSSVL